MEDKEENQLLDLEKASNLTELDQSEKNLSRANIPEAMNLYFCLKIFPSNEEYFVYLLRSSFLIFEGGAQKERFVYINLKKNIN